MTDSTSLDQLRNRIDTLAEQLQTLINERGELAQEVAKTKQQNGDNTQFYRAEREAQILRNIVARNKGPISGEDMARLFREVMSVCLALEQPLKIAYLGPQGTFTQAASLKHFGQAVETLPIPTIDEVFREVEAGAAHYGVVPVENSTEGVIDHTLDMFLRTSLSICGEVELRVHHNLLSQTEDLGKIKIVYAHQQSLAQCREWLDAHLAGAVRMAVSSNAEGARRASGEKGSAAIASSVAADIYNIPLQQQNIEDDPDNTTRFIVIGPNKVAASGGDKTSLLASTNNQSGALFRLLQPFEQNGISLSRIESRPSRVSMWDYVFFIDIEGHTDDDNVAKAIKALEKQAAMIKVLGSYPKAVL